MITIFFVQENDIYIYRYYNDIFRRRNTETITNESISIRQPKLMIFR